MAAKTLIILTHNFPVQKGEVWLAEELKHITGNWESIQVYCDNNLGQTRAPDYPQLTLLPNTFIYKRSWSALFKGCFMSALVNESFSLLAKGEFFSNIISSISVLLRTYSRALWFTKHYIDATKEYILYSYWGDESATLACLIKCQNPKVKAICRVHGVDVFEEQTAAKHIPFRGFQLKHLSAMYSVSQAGNDHLKKHFPKYTQKIETSYMGTSDNGLNPLPDNKRLELVSCALVRNVKRLELVVEILKHIKQPVRWTLAGNGPDFEKLKELCKMLPVNISINLLGYQSTEEIEKMYRTSPFHYYISVSSTEGLPVGLMESISYGVPVIATDVGGCREIVNSTTGALIKPDFDPADVASLISDMFVKYDYSPEQRKRAHNYWNEKFNAEKNYKAFYKKLSEINE